MVEVSDSMLATLGIGVTAVLGLFYFMTTRKDKSKFDTQSNVRSDEEAERDKLELARKVKKELADEAEKVETIRKSVAVDVRLANQVDVDQKIREVVSGFDHKLDMYEQKIDSMFRASDLIMKNLMDKIVDIAKTQTDALIKINDSITALKQLFYEISGKVNRVEREQDKQRSD